MKSKPTGSAATNGEAAGDGRKGGKRPPTTKSERAPRTAAEHAADAPMTRAGEMLQIRGLIERVGMINRIHSALRSTLNVEDLHTIILTSFVSPSALDFSRAILVGYDETRESFHGLAALGASTPAEHARIQQEIADEERALATMVQDLRSLEPTQEEQRFFSQSLSELTSHSFWITTYQKFMSDDNLQRAVRAVEIPCPRLESGREPSGHTVCQFLNELSASGNAQLVSQRQLRAAQISPELLALLPETSLWGIVRTQKGVRLLIIADKTFHAEPLDQTDLLHVDWFIGQVSLALENAEMFKAMEAALNSLRELDRMKSNFLATISHELRTPLTAITGYVQLMLNNKVGSLSAGQKEVLERILAHSELLTGKVNDLIEIAELDAGRELDINLVPVDPLNALMSILPRVEQRRAHKGITIEPIVTSSIPPVRCNPDALQRIFFHLIDNAVKFGRQKGHVFVRFVPRGEELHIEIEDDGIGISKALQQNIFEAFFQVDNQLTRHYEGMGIGLAIIKKQLALTGGRITVQSEPGHGSTFTIVYPLSSN